MVHPDLERPFKPDVMGHKYFQVFVNEASRDKRVRGLKTRGVAADVTANYIDELAREDIHVKCNCGDGAGELGTSAEVQRIPTNRRIRWRISPPRTCGTIALRRKSSSSLCRQLGPNYREPDGEKIIGFLQWRMQHSRRPVSPMSSSELGHHAKD